MEDGFTSLRGWPTWPESFEAPAFLFFCPLSTQVPAKSGACGPMPRASLHYSYVTGASLRTPRRIDASLIAALKEPYHDASLRVLDDA